MAPSGVTGFNLSVNQIIDEAAALVGGNPIQGEEVISALRHLNFLLIDLTNNGVPLWSMEMVETTLSATTTYSLPASTVDVLYGVVHTSATNGNGNATDFFCERLGAAQYLSIPNKEMESQRPTQYYVERGRDNPTLHVWPKPNTTCTFKHWRIRELESATALANQTLDIPYRFLGALTIGLAYRIGLSRINGKDPEGDKVLLAKLNLLKGEYEAVKQNARDEDRERSSFRVKPKVPRGY